MACEAASAIRTVQSLTREGQCLQAYSASLDEPERRSNRTALVANAYYSLSQASVSLAFQQSFSIGRTDAPLLCNRLTFFVIAIIFWWGSQNLANGQMFVRFASTFSEPEH